MSKTSVNLKNSSFLINGKLTYEEISTSKPSVHGLLMNARFIQGIFDDKNGRERYARFGYSKFDPDDNTDRLIAELPNWYKYGLRAFTVGLQGGGPCFTVDNNEICNNPFGENGKNLDPAYKQRLDRLIKAADETGMVVIISFFYGAQAKRLRDDQAREDAVKTAARFLKEGGYTNVIIEIANEHNVGAFATSPNIYAPDGVVELMKIAKKESGGLLVGCSGGGGYLNKKICDGSDVVLIHGNGCSRQKFYNLIWQAQQLAPNKPIVCNEDSQAIGQLEVAFKTRTSWGYYNNMTKQEPPANWGITKGEDIFFAYRMASGLGIEFPDMPDENQFYLQGLEPNMEYMEKRWIRLASLYPEKINYVDFYCNNKLIYTNYDEPFSLYFKDNWKQGAWQIQSPEEEWKAVINLRDGKVIEKVATTKQTNA